ncbi:hypothetical protein SDJN02_02042, partial [Cucurbita argyrosperma subsp. argyrosperma]
MKNIVGILASREISTNTKKITESQRRLHSCAILEDHPKVFEWITSCQLPVRSIIKFDESNWKFVQA